MAVKMKASENFYKVVKHFESCILKPYRCPAKVPTIGWGNTVYPNGRKVTMKDPAITQAYADQMHHEVVAKFEAELNSILPFEIDQNKYDALLSFGYNVGMDIDQDNIPEGLADSTLFKKVLKDPNDTSIWGEFCKWNKANGKVLPGLTRRRNCEAHLFFKNEVNFYENMK